MRKWLKGARKAVVAGVGTALVAYFGSTGTDWEWNNLFGSLAVGALVALGTYAAKNELPE